MINWIVSSSVLILAVIAIRFIFRGHIKLKLQYALWLLVLTRLLVPIQLGSSEASLANYVPQEEQLIEIVREAALPAEPLFEEVQTAVPGEIQTGSEVSKGINFSQLVRNIWIAGGVLTGLCILLSNLYFYMKLKRSRRALNIKAMLPVYECLWLETPCMFGFLKPSIYINGIQDERELEHVLCHESMHYKQGDHLWSWLRSLCLMLHWYNPLVWVAAVLSKRDAELACDEAVIRTLGEDERIEYGRTLIRMTCSGRPAFMSLATTMKGSRKSITERIKILAAKPRMKLYTVAAVVLIAAAAVGCTFTGAEKDAAEVPAEPEVSVEEPQETKLPVYMDLGVIFDRNGNAFDPEVYDGLKGSTETFAEYLNEGRDVQLTIDLEFQKQAEALLDEALNIAGDSSSAALVVVDVDNGEPLAIVSRGGERNLAINSVYSPGNLFLPCTAMAALGTGIVEISTGIECRGVFDRYEFYGYAPQCEKYLNGHHSGEQNVVTALVNNCQYYFYCLGNDLGIDTTGLYARDFGLGEDPGIELEATAGFMANREMEKPDGETWQIADTIEACVGGNGSAFSPLQLAEYCATIANGGNRYSASVVKGVYEWSGSKLYARHGTVVTVDNEDEYEWKVLRRALHDINNPDDAESIAFREGMWELSGIGNGGNGVSDRLYMGFAPYENPEIAIAVVVEDTQNTYAANNLAMDVVLAYQQLKEGGNA